MWARVREKNGFGFPSPCHPGKSMLKIMRKDVPLQSGTKTDADKFADHKSPKYWKMSVEMPKFFIDVYDNHEIFSILIIAIMKNDLCWL